MTNLGSLVEGILLPQNKLSREIMEVSSCGSLLIPCGMVHAYTLSNLIVGPDNNDSDDNNSSSNNF